MTDLNYIIRKFGHRADNLDKLNVDPEKYWKHEIICNVCGGKIIAVNSLNSYLMRNICSVYMHLNANAHIIYKWTTIYSDGELLLEEQDALCTRLKVLL